MRCWRNCATCTLGVRATCPLEVPSPRLLFFCLKYNSPINFPICQAVPLSPSQEMSRNEILMGYVPICRWSQAASNINWRAFVLTSNNGEKSSHCGWLLEPPPVTFAQQIWIPIILHTVSSYVIVCWPLLFLAPKWGCRFPPPRPLPSVKNEAILYANS